MFVGIDFGTSNTSAAVYDGKNVVYIPLDPLNTEDPHVLSSMVYVSSAGDKCYGHQAIREYIDRMSGRPVQFKQQSYGYIDMDFGDLTYTPEVFYMVEKDLPGRLFQYLKKHLGTDIRTNVFGRIYTPYELVAFLLKYVKDTAENVLQKKIHGALLGRPVRFSENDAINDVAEDDLLMACKLAGFKHVELQYEPVAAAYNYSLGARDNENILIFDFGGGTFDATVMRVQHHTPTILGLEGVPVGGSDFDRSIMQKKIALHFGKGWEVVGSRKVPNRIYQELLNWQTIVQLNKDRLFLKNLDDLIFYAENPAPFKSLKRLIRENHGFTIFQQIEQAKKELSTISEAIIEYRAEELFAGEGAIEIHQPVSRQEFEQMLAGYSEKIMRCIRETLNAAGLSVDDIHHVIRVGGSAKIPFFHHLLAQTFGHEKLLMKDEFKNVAAGLAIEASRKRAQKIIA